MRSNLSRLLLEPLPLSGLKRLLIVPDESLQYIPFAALLFPGSGAGKELLVKHFEIDVLPSASVLGILRKATEQANSTYGRRRDFRRSGF